MEQPPGKIVWHFLKKLKIQLLYDPAISLLDIYPREVKTCAHKSVYMNANSGIIH